MSYSIPGYSEDPFAWSRDRGGRLMAEIGIALGDLAAAQEEAIAASREWGRLVRDFMRRAGLKPAGGRALRSKRLRKKAGLG